MVIDNFNLDEIQNKTKREAAKEFKSKSIDDKVKEDLKKAYELLDKVEKRVSFLEEKFYRKYLPEDYLIFDSSLNVIQGVNIGLINYTLNSLCKIMYEDNAKFGTLGEEAMTRIHYNFEFYDVPVQVLPQIYNLLKRINILLGQSECTINDLDYFNNENTIKKENDEQTELIKKRMKKIIGAMVIISFTTSFFSDGMMAFGFMWIFFIFFVDSKK